MLAGARAHLAWQAAADSKMEVSAYFTTVHIPSFGRAVTAKQQTAKWKYLLISQVCIYRLLEGL